MTGEPKIALAARLEVKRFNGVIDIIKLSSILLVILCEFIALELGNDKE
jgi:hypothetical protein